MDPYPRKPDAEIPSEWKAEAEAEPAAEKRANPFSVLKKLRENKG
jgi:hypothetical protein